MRTLDRVSGVSIHGCLTSVHFGLVFGSCSSCLCFASGFLPTPHYCDAVAFGYLIPPCQRLIGDFHPSYVSCLTYNRVGGFRPLSHHRTCHLWHTAVSRRVIGPGTRIPAATLLSLLARHPVNSSALSRGFGLAPLSLFQSRLRTFQYFLALLL